MLSDALTANSEQLLERKIRESKKELEGSVAMALSKWTEHLSGRVEQKVSRSLVSLAGIALAGNKSAATPHTFTEQNVQAVRDSTDEMHAELVASHAAQIAELKAEMALERKAHARLLKQQEKGLAQRYDVFIESLNEKVAAANEKKLQMAMEYIERSARQDSEKVILLHTQTGKAESVASQRFKSVVTELHKSWEEEEGLRSRNLQNQQQAHFQAVLHHMENQLDLSLRTQSEADKQWLEDLEARNQANAETLLKFEAKCKKVYDARFKNYVVKTSRRFKEYEEQFLAMGRTLATEKTACESQINRMKVAMTQWKAEYHNDIKRRYDEAVEVMQTRYDGEIDRLMSELQEARNAAAGAVKSMADEHAALLHNRRHDTATAHSATIHKVDDESTADIGRLCNDLKDTWTSLKVPAEDRIVMLTQLINECPVTPQFLLCYDELTAKLQERMPISELLSKQKFLEYRIRQQANRKEGFKEGSDELHALEEQLASVTGELSTAMLSYEKKYKQKFQV